ncbi:MAG: type II toxin-antitoxin system death-on-curing family toxin [Minwuia sp.]|nr:type II toxin-antitoxin system death-on-curing family toxin [Minwuia sp.]
MHDMQLAEHGGLPGVRDANLLDSALARPRNLFAYGETDIRRLAAAYAFGLARNHPFVDGKKRTAFLAAYMFLRLNDWRLIAEEAAAATMTLALAAGQVTEPALAEWLCENTRKMIGNDI